MYKKDYEMIERSAKIIDKLRSECPLTHCITNYVTINDCANAVLAIGGSPAMANEEPEIEDFVNIADATVINMGTLLADQIEAMQKAAIHTKKTDTPLVIDPVAVGVSKLRNDATVDLINKSNPYIIRGNMSEIKAIAKLFDVDENDSKAKGVDVSDEDIIKLENLENNAELIKDVASKLNTTINVSGPVDIISDGENVYAIDNGEPIMSKITGSGCMLTCVLGAFSSVSSPLEASIIGSMSMAIAGELAYNKVQINNLGSGSFRTFLIDELYNMNEEKINKYAKLYKVI